MSRIRSGWTRLLTVAVLVTTAGAPTALAQETVDLDADLPVLSVGDCVGLAGEVKESNSLLFFRV